jgi:dTDP-4-amino-4,6-dideoxygalactose transaminase
MISSKLIRLSKSSISDTEKQAVMKVLDSEFLGMGVNVQKFESELSEFLQRPAVCVATGTAAIHLALQAIGVGVGDEVLVPSLTYVASFQAISATGAIPVACDVLPETLTISPQDAETKITSNTRAIMPVHYGGGLGEIEKVYELASKYNLRVVEDAAHAFGTTHNNTNVGAFGDIVCFSFDGIKNITAGEGGCIVTSDLEVLNKVRDARLLGVENDTEKRYSGERSWTFDVSAQGWRYHMSDIMAAIGIVQLKRFSDFMALRKNFGKLYSSLLNKVEQVTLIANDYDCVVPHIFPIILAPNIDREVVKAELLLKNVQVGAHYQPNHLLTFYSQYSKGALPVTERVHTQILSLPMHADLDQETITYICQELIGILESGKANG